MRRWLLLLLVLLLPTAGLAEETVPFDIEGDWWAETLFPGYYADLPDWISTMLDVAGSQADFTGMERMTVEGDVLMRLTRVKALGCAFEDGDRPHTIALMCREFTGWRSYFNAIIHSYRFEDGKFIDLDLNGWKPFRLEGDVLTLEQRSGELSGQITVYNADVFEWRNSDQEYVEDGVNYGVPWMLFVRQSAVE